MNQSTYLHRGGLQFNSVRIEKEKLVKIVRKLMDYLVGSET